MLSRALKSRLPLCALAVVGLVAGLTPSERFWARAASRARIVGYYVHDDPSAWKTLTFYGDRLASIITTNYNVSDASGRLQGTHDARAMEAARSRGAAVHFRLSNVAGEQFDRSVAHAILTDRRTKARALSDILATLDAQGYDGVNIDLERVPPTDRAALTAFTAELQAALRPRGKVLSIAVPGRTGDDLTDPFGGAFDLAALGALADWIVIMAYDEHWDTGPPGPVASLPWVEAVVRHTLSQVSPTKTLLGIALYGYDWPARGPGEGISMQEAVRRAQRAGASILWDERARVPYFRTADRIVYFENARSIAHKLAVGERAGLAGIATWRLGHELPDVWETIGGGQAAANP